MKKKFNPLGVRSSQPGWVGWMGQVKGQKKQIMFCIHIWIPCKIPSILSIHTWGENEILSSPYTKNNFWRQVWAKCGPDLLNSLDLLGGGALSGFESGHPPWEHVANLLLFPPCHLTNLGLLLSEAHTALPRGQHRVQKRNLNHPRQGSGPQQAKGVPHHQVYTLKSK